MGLNYLGARLMWEARLRGASFADTLTVARLSLNLHRAEVTELRRLYRHSVPEPAQAPLSTYAFGEYCDQFIRTFLGAVSISILDYSPYEGATIIHDLNTPVPSTLWGRFDAVIEGGSLEHIFNFPVAIANLMRLTKVGGRVYMIVPANNMCGHGFYQFSPELMYRVFTPDNGFRMERLILFTARYPSVSRVPFGQAYEVADPKTIEKRIGLVSKQPIMMFVEAEKTVEVTPFTAMPLQSDYERIWRRSSTMVPERTGLHQLVAFLVAKLPKTLRAMMAGSRQLRYYSFSNRRFYRPLTFEQVPKNR